MLRARQAVVVVALTLSMASLSAYGQARVLDGSSQQSLERSASEMMDNASQDRRAAFSRAFEVMTMHEALSVLKDDHGLTGRASMDVSRLTPEDRQVAKVRLMDALDGKSMDEVIEGVRSDDYDRARTMVMFIKRKAQASTPIEGTYTSAPSEAGAFTSPE